MLLVGGCLGGCSLYSSNKIITLSDAEGRVPQYVYADNGATPIGKTGLLKQLGPPSLQQDLTQTSSLYTWALTHSQQQETRFLLLYHTQKTTRKQVFFHVVFTEDRVLKHWIDQDLQVDTASQLTRREQAMVFSPETPRHQSLVVPHQVPPVTTVIQAGRGD